MVESGAGTPSTLMITPYYRESRVLIERCIASVATQSVPTDHILVADGEPAGWIDAVPVRHIVLDRCHRNYGNTPRALGLMLGVSEGYRAIGLLDADNFIDPDHVASCLTARDRFPEADYIIAYRRFVDIDGNVMPLADEPVENHVDTSCFFFLPGSFAALPVWGLIPDEGAAISDRIFYAALRARGLIGACTGRPTVNYRVTIAELYQQLGLAVPPEAKPRHDVAAIARWLAGLDDAALERIEQRCGVRLRTTLDAIQ